ncbi:MAG: hypothetical protein JSS26_19765 [Nitrospira sp.]|nr:hypothetical protein [Nitrospira sp.]
MDISLAISILALLVSALSALYARWAASEAKHANRISSHSHKLAVLESARNFRAGFQVNGESLEAAYFYSLLDSASKASLYFTKPVTEHLSKYAEAAHNVLIARESVKLLQSVNSNAAPAKWEEIFQLVDACRAIEGSLLADLESQTRIVS